MTYDEVFGHIFFQGYHRMTPPAVGEAAEWQRRNDLSFSFSCEKGAFTNIPTCSHAHDAQTRNNDLWITQRVALCANRIRYTFHDSQLLSNFAKLAVMIIKKTLTLKKK
ncbi:hypothetical protein SFRURICE_018753 [Spodoptera frugiperda]|nr:hypothetical protein SFRURICE_018753 [Spodoptera frugiperda]